jgi:hypothetical protein
MVAGFKLAAGGVAAAAALGFGFGGVTAFAAEPKVEHLFSTFSQHFTTSPPT